MSLNRDSNTRVVSPQQLGLTAWRAIAAENATEIPIGCLDVNNVQVNVTSACSQVVAGTNYVLNMRVTLPGCNLVNNNVVVRFSTARFVLDNYNHPQ